MGLNSGFEIIVIRPECDMSRYSAAACYKGPTDWPSKFSTSQVDSNGNSQLGVAPPTWNGRWMRHFSRLVLQQAGVVISALSKIQTLSPKILLPSAENLETKAVTPRA